MVEEKLNSENNLPTVLKNYVADSVDIVDEDKDRIIQMAWEDRTTFETIKERSGMSESEVIKIMRSELKPSAFKLWRKRMKGRTTKHRALRSPEMKFSDLSIANHRRALGEHMKLASKQRFLNQF